MKIGYILIGVLFLFSCKEAGLLENALEQAGKNRNELFAVLEHYSKSPDDSLKLKAAKFLIANMPGHYTLDCPGMAVMRKHLENSDTLITSKQPINVWWKETKTKKTDYRILSDLHTVKASFLINNIDGAFRTWQDAPWHNEVNFDDFCNYILPYRIADEGLAEGWRDSLSRMYYPVIQGVGDVRKAFVLLRDTIWKRTQLSNPEFGHTPDVWTMRKQGIMTCMQGCIYLGSVARALGLPVVCDRVFQWANYSNQGHNWIALAYGNHTYTAIDGDTIACEFNKIDAAEFPELCKPESDYPLDVSLKKRAAKIWRFAYRQNDRQQIDGKLARFLVFSRNHAEDVSAQYGFHGEVVLPVNSDIKDVLLCVYSSGDDWLPIDYVQAKNNKAVFQHLGDSIVYQAMVFSGDSLCPTGHPFLLLPDGRHELIPDVKQVRDIELSRKYPCSFHWTNQWGRMKGSYFEASDDSIFRSSVRLYTFSTMPVFRNEIVLSSKKSYRYIRYVSAPECSVPITELAFYDGGSYLSGRAFGSKMESPERAFDGDTSTLIYSQKPGYSVGMDFGVSQVVTRMVLFPKNDGNFVIPGHTYELLYYDEGWHTLGQQISTGFSVTFSNVPSRALLLLKNRTSGKEERIFTYEQNRLSWW